DEHPLSRARVHHARGRQGGLRATGIARAISIPLEPFPIRLTKRLLPQETHFRGSDCVGPAPCCPLLVRRPPSWSRPATRSPRSNKQTASLPSVSSHESAYGSATQPQQHCKNRTINRNGATCHIFSQPTYKNQQ